MRRTFELLPYKPHCVCFKCRKTFKIHWLKKVLWTSGRVAGKRRLVPAAQHHRYELPPEKPGACPQCGGELYVMPLTFKAPPKRDIKAWREIELNYQHNSRTKP